MKYHCLIRVCSFFFSVASFSFSGFEHLTIGDLLDYHFPSDNTGLGDQRFGKGYPYASEMATIRQELDYVEPIRGQYLIIRSADKKSEMMLSPGEIVALAADYIANPEATISKPNASWDELKQRFMAAYKYMIPFKDNWFWTTTVLASDRLPRYRNHLRKSLDNLIEVIREVKNEEPNKADRVGRIHLKLISGKNSIEKIIEQALISQDFYKYKELLNKNIDHFGDDGNQAYLVGHLIALEKAVEAKALYDQGQQKEGRYRLNEAYTIEAFALHFLSDAFASGHMLTPRRGLLEMAQKNPEFFSLDVGLMANAQHDETNWLGLIVKNKAGDIWRAYGDNGYFDMRDEDNAKQITKALQASIDEVWNAFKSGHYPKPENFIAEQLRPIPLPNGETVLPDGRRYQQTHNQLFIEKNGEFLVRGNVYDYTSSQYKPIKPAFISSLHVWLKSPVDKYSSSDFSTFQSTGLTKKLTLKAKIKCYTKYYGAELAGALNEGKELNETYDGLYIPFEQLNFQKKGASISAETKMYLFNTDKAHEIYDKCERLIGSKPVNIQAKAVDLTEFISVLKERIKVNPLWLPVGVFDKDGAIYRLKGSGEDYFTDHYQKNELGGSKALVAR